jgi:hypothetical protein
LACFSAVEATLSTGIAIPPLWKVAGASDGATQRPRRAAPRRK